MHVTFLRLQNFRSFVDTGEIHLADINVLIGANNAGKSSVLRGLHLLQQGLGDTFADVRVGASHAQIDIGLINRSQTAYWGIQQSNSLFTYTLQLKSNDRRTGDSNTTIRSEGRNQTGSNLLLPAREPNHFIIPVLSKRKAIAYHEDIREQYVLSITPDVSHLAAKLSRLGNPAFPLHDVYASACKQILGFVVTAIPSPNGQRAGIYLPCGQTIPIDQLGEGVPNIVHLLVNLVMSKEKLFLIEEPENDLHPQALKALLDLIIASASNNQFVISTHSNIVVRHLCAAQGSCLFRVRPKSNALPIESEIEQVSDSSEARLAVLSELGYSLSDFELWDGWLILEESSAERIIRDYLIPWFTPSLSRIRTIASGGTSKVSATFEDLNRLFLFTHLTPLYQHSSWVLVDGDLTGTEVVGKLRSKFPDYEAMRFQTLTEHAFERYYPTNFSEKVDSVLAIKKDQERRDAKKQLLAEVMQWLDKDMERGKSALKQSAAEVISILQYIQASITARRHDA